MVGAEIKQGTKIKNNSPQPPPLERKNQGPS